MKRILSLLLSLLVAIVAVSVTPSWAATPGGVFVTGHDADYHAIAGNTTGAQNIIRRAVEYVTFGKVNPHMLLVTDLRNPGGDQVDSRLGVTAAGYTYDVADYGSGTAGVLDLHTVSFGAYDVIVVASDYGGWLRQDELDVLNSRSGDVIAFINNGGGLVALNESGNRGSGYPGTAHDRYGFLPFLVSEVGLHQHESGVHVTPAGAAMGLTDSDVNGNVAHSFFSGTGGLDIIDVDSEGRALSLATRGKSISTGGPCTPDPSLGWNAPLSPNSAYNLSVGVTLPISFRWGTCSQFMHDESVIVMIVDQANPDVVITAHVYGSDIMIDDASQSYYLPFRPADYAVPAGANLQVMVFIAESLAGTATIHVTP